MFAAFNHFHSYLMGLPIVVVVDHLPLIWLLKGKHTQGRLAKWVMIIQGSSRY